MALAVIDIGGTSIKFAVWDGTALSHEHAEPTPDNLDDFYVVLETAVAEMKKTTTLDGVAISSPGAVNQETGVIEGMSALPYIHNFPIVPELAKRFGLPVAIENDANSAALAEVTSGAAAGLNRVIVLVIGTGVGGAIIANGKVEHGAHLLGGEFGYMWQNGAILSVQGTAVSAAAGYSKATGETVDGKVLFERAAAGDELATTYAEKLYQALAEAIFNLQYSFDPERVLIGGAVSQNPALVPGIDRHLDAVMEAVGIATVKPDVRAAKYLDRANLIGAVANFAQRYPAR